jgi:hypothetical protein
MHPVVVLRTAGTAKGQPLNVKEFL